MEQPPAWCAICVCGRSFSVQQAYTFHKQSCNKTKKRFADALGQAKDAWRSRKRRKLEAITLSKAIDLPVTTDTDEPDTGMPDQSIIMSETRIVDLIAVTNTSDMDQSIAERRSRRENRRLPKRYRDVLPDIQLPKTLSLPECTPLPQPAPSLQSTSLTQSAPSQSPLPKVNFLKSACNNFWLYRQYKGNRFPDHDPHENVTFHDFIDDLTDATTDPESEFTNYYEPYPNRSSFLLGEWYWNGCVKKSFSDFKKLIDIVGHPEFRPEDVASTRWTHADNYLSGDLHIEGNESSRQAEPDDGAWFQTPIKLQVPFPKRSLHPGQKDFLVGCLRHKKLIPAIREKISRQSAHLYLHFEPYELHWKPPGASDPVRVYGDLYTSDAFIKAHDEIQNLPGEPNCDLPRVVVGIMFASDATHLTSFSDAQLSPVYMGIGNESKDRRSRPSCHAFEHVAYFEKLPAAFKSFAAEHMGGKGPSSAFLAHCSRELYHAQWDIMLDEEFLLAYVHGFVVMCCNGVRRRFYPRIFTYSADYPEKVIIAGIRNLGCCPCPRCLMPLCTVDSMGKPRDMMQRNSLLRVDDARRRNRVVAARKILYEKQYTVNSKAIENLLHGESLVPTMNAFSTKLAEFGFCMYLMLVVDLMHEFELGVWKMIFIHLLRILDCVNDGLKHELDRRLRQIPPFGRDAIRKITSNRSELKKMTAHDYEDILQCAIPVFDGLLPEPHNTRILKLLFDMAHWHGLAKLRIHTDTTLDAFTEVTTSLGNSLRNFRDNTCSSFETRELERERAARQRREEKKGPDSKTGSIQGPVRNVARRSKHLNLNTYKVHALGDYPSTIRFFGTTDSYTTQWSELEHRTSKNRFLRTNGRSIPIQLSKIERRQRRIHKIREKIHGPSHQPDLESVDRDSQVQYNIAKSQNEPVHIPTFLHKNRGDPAVKNFSSKLRKHLLPRVRDLHRQEAMSFACDFAVDTAARDLTSAHEEDWSTFVYFKDDRIYHHKQIRFHFTTYDVRRGSDTVNSGTSRCSIMLLSDDADAEDCAHHFLYARVLGAYHANVTYTGPGMRDFEARRLDFLWVRWYEVVDPESSGFKNRRLDSVRFLSLNDDEAFGFVDPKDVLRGCHIIPAFATGKRYLDGVGFSKCAKDSRDYRRYYVGRFSERDLLMRYHWGLGIGHLHVHGLSADPIPLSECAVEETEEVPNAGSLEEGVGTAGVAACGADENSGDDGCTSDDPEFGVEDREREFDEWEDVNSCSEDSDNVDSDEEDVQSEVDYPGI